MEPFELQNPIGWGVPDFSGYPLTKQEVEERRTESPEEFLRRAEETIADEGVWKATTEYRMGGTTTVEVTTSTTRDRCYRTTATFGLLITTGEYETLEHALRAAPLIAYGLWSVRKKGGAKGLVGG